MMRERELLTFVGIAALFVLLVLLQRWPVAVAYVGAVLSFAAHAHGAGLHWPVFAWFAYCFTFWSVGHDRDDNVLLLTVTSLAQAAGLVLTETARDALDEHRGSVALAAAAVLMIPFRCNNMHYTPGVSLARLVLYSVAATADRRRHWLAHQYPLFATQEVVFFLLVCHTGLFFRRRESPRQPPPLPLTDAKRVAAILARA